MNSLNQEEERDKLQSIDEYTILDYIWSSVEILMNLKIEEYEEDLDEKVKKRIKDLKLDERGEDSEGNEGTPNNYEKLI